MKFAIKTVAACALVACAGAAFAQKGETVKIAFIDPLSGPFANVGQNQLKSWQFVADRLSGAKNPAGVKFEVVGFDNKGSPQESLNSLKAAIAHRATDPARAGRDPPCRTRARISSRARR